MSQAFTVVESAIPPSPSAISSDAEKPPKPRRTLGVVGQAQEAVRAACSSCMKFT